MSGHIVQFYEKESFLSGVVADFLGGGLAEGRQAVVIATPSHRRAFADELTARGVDVDDRLLLLDAEETLALFMEDGQPDAHRFKAAVGGILEPEARAYGEMVDLLSRAGNVDAAIRLEELWNDVVDERKIALLCAYPIGTFAKHSDREAFEKICHRHSDVRPTESLSTLGEVALLQQRAAALNDERAFLLEAAEVLHRSLDYETRLRELAALIVPRLADACEIDVVRSDNTCDRFADGQLVLHQSSGAGLAEVLRTGQPRLHGGRVVVPMQIAGRTLGAITLVAHTRHYTDADLPLLAELARRSAVAIENSRLFRMAQEANRAKDAFLATLSHELRTPLTAILGWARMLRLGPMSEEITNAALETIERSAKTQANLIDDILDISKVVTGKVSLEMEPVDLASAVDGAIETVRLAAAAKRVRVEFDRPVAPAIVTGDATRLQQIAWNLLSNAIKFSPADSEVRVEIVRNCTLAHLVVRDRGVGIPRDFLPHVFEAFRQAEASSTRTYGGLGLGLAIVKSFAELHGGSVSVESAGEGEGATFTVALPLAG
jgi:signal transduction histidine kinase